MKLSRCPICHSHISLDAMVQDDAGRTLLAQVSALPHFVAKPLLAYLGLFRPAKQDLSNSRAAKLLEQVLEMYTADHVLASALTDTVQKLQEKRIAHNDAKPLTNHSYLKQVYQTMALKMNANPAPKSSTHQTPTPTTPANGDDWYREQAARMQRIGQDPLKSSIGERLKEISWQPDQAT